MAARMHVFAGALGVIAALLLPATGDADSTPNGTKYFQSFATNYRLPFSPRGEISKAEALQRGTYYVAEYSDGNLIRFVKILHDVQFFEHRYTYHASGKLRSVDATNDAGEVRTMQFDADGHQLDP